MTFILTARGAERQKIFECFTPVQTAIEEEIIRSDNTEPEYPKDTNILVQVHKYFNGTTCWRSLLLFYPPAIVCFQEDWSLFMVTKKRTTKLKMTEFDETFSEDHAEGTEVSWILLIHELEF